MPDETNEKLPDWLAKALSELPWDEVRVPHLPLRLHPGLAERDARIDAMEADARRMTLMLGAIKAWCSRNGHTYAEKLAMHGLGESVSPPESPTVPVA